MRRLLLPLILPVGVAWVKKQERRILSAGVPLNQEQLHDAVAAGVKHAERVRLLRVDAVPSLRLQGLNTLAFKLRLLSPYTAGLTARYGIFIREDFWENRSLITHELAHTAQYERLGGIKPFLRDYLGECLVEGYPFGPLEAEAAKVAQQICG